MFSSKKLLYLALASSLVSQTQYLSSACQESQDIQATIRKYNHDTDCKCVKKIIQDNYKHLYHNVLSDIGQGTNQLISDCLQNRYKTHWVLIHENKVVGFIVFYQEYFDDQEYSLENKLTGYIELLAVDQEYRGKGFGKMLLNRAQEELLNAGRTVFVLNCHNKDSFGFYEKCGFRLIDQEVFEGQYITWYTWYKEDTSCHALFKRFRHSLFTAKNRDAMLGGLVIIYLSYSCWCWSKKNCMSKLWRYA